MEPRPEEHESDAQPKPTSEPQMKEPKQPEPQAEHQQSDGKIIKIIQKK